MGQIKNKDLYPQDPTISVNDYLVGTDSETQRTYTFTVGSLLSLVGGGGILPVYTINLQGNTLELLRDGLVVDTVDLSEYENVFVSSGTLDIGTGVITFTRSDLTTFDVDISGIQVDVQDLNTATATKDIASVTETTIKETVTSLSLTDNTLTFTDENGVSTPIDLSIYLDNTNLSRITSGQLNSISGELTLTRNDSTTISIDLSAFLSGTDLTNTSQLINDGEDGTSRYVQEVELGNTAFLDMDAALNLTSNNPVYNSVITNALQNKLDKGGYAGTAQDLFDSIAAKADVTYVDQQDADLNTLITFNDSRITALETMTFVSDEINDILSLVDGNSNTITSVDVTWLTAQGTILQYDSTEREIELQDSNNNVLSSVLLDDFRLDLWGYVPVSPTSPGVVWTGSNTSGLLGGVQSIDVDTMVGTRISNVADDIASNLPTANSYTVINMWQNAIISPQLFLAYDDGSLDFQDNFWYSNRQGTIKYQVASRDYVDSQVSSTKHAENIGDGTATQYDVLHNLNSLDVIVQVFYNATGAEVEVSNIRLDANTVRIIVNNAFTTDEARVIVKK